MKNELEVLRDRVNTLKSTIGLFEQKEEISNQLKAEQRKRIDYLESVLGIENSNERRKGRVVKLR